MRTPTAYPRAAGSTACECKTAGKASSRTLPAVTDDTRRVQFKGHQLRDRRQEVQILLGIQPQALRLVTRVQLVRYRQTSKAKYASEPSSIGSQSIKKYADSALRSEAMSAELVGKRWIKKKKCAEHLVRAT